MTFLAGVFTGVLLVLGWAFLSIAADDATPRPNDRV